MTQTEPTDDEAEEIVLAIYALVDEKLENDVSRPDIERLLLDQGLDATSAVMAVEDVVRQRSERVRLSAERRLRNGAVWLPGGLLITWGTYHMAGSGEQYVVAWGAILVGGIQCLRGFLQWVGRD